MDALQKTLVSFLLSAFLFAVIVFFLFSGVLVNEPDGIVILASVFLTLFLIVFFCFNIRQEPADQPEPETKFAEIAEPQDITEELEVIEEVIEAEPEELEELEAVTSEEETVPVNPAQSKESKALGLQVPNVQIAFGNDDVPYLVESSGLELVDGDLNEIARFIEIKNTAEPEKLKKIEEKIEDIEEIEEIEDLEELEAAADLPPLPEADEDIAELEEIAAGSGGSFSIFRQPGVHAFTFSSGNPELLDAEVIHAESLQAESVQAGTQVIYEHNGIHYINNNFDSDTDMDSAFAKLVEEVVNVNQ